MTHKCYQQCQTNDIHITGCNGPKIVFLCQDRTIVFGREDLGGTVINLYYTYVGNSLHAASFFTVNIYVTESHNVICFVMSMIPNLRLNFFSLFLDLFIEYSS